MDLSFTNSLILFVLIVLVVVRLWKSDCVLNKEQYSRAVFYVLLTIGVIIFRAVIFLFVDVRSGDVSRTVINLTSIAELLFIALSLKAMFNSLTDGKSESEAAEQ